MKRQKKRGPDRNRIHVHPGTGNVTEFQKKEKRHKKRVSIPLILLLVWIGLYFGSVLFPVSYYGLAAGGLAFEWRPAAVYERFMEQFRQSYDWFVCGNSDSPVAVVYCRYLAAGLAGAALAACGTAFQGAFKNVLAGPSTMGVMSGGTMGALIYLLLFYNPIMSSLAVKQEEMGLAYLYHMTFWETYAQQFCILAGCFGGVLLILFIATVAGKGKLSSAAMIVSGTVFSGVISNVLMVVQYVMLARDSSDPRVEILKELMLGGFENISSISEVLMMGVPIVICLIILLCVRGKLNLLSFGMDEAEAMGVNVKRYRNLMVLIGAVLTAMVIAFCGRMGFIGFMIPLLLRKLCGPDLRILLPASMAGGAIFLTVVYDLARLANVGDGINMFTSIVGCTVLVTALLRKRGGGRDAASQGRNPMQMGMR